MPDQSGYNARTPTDMLNGVGVLRATVGGAANTVVGVSRGGLQFHPGIEMRESEFDGRRSPLVGGDRITFRRPTFAGTMLQAGEEDLRLFEPGGSGALLVVTPKLAGTQFVIGDYVAGMSMTYARSGPGLVKITFAYAICKQYDINAQDANEGEIPVVFEARLDRADVGNTDLTVPYTITVTDA